MAWASKPVPTGVCGHCGQVVALTKSGHMRPHSYKKMTELATFTFKCHRGGWKPEPVSR